MLATRLRAGKIKLPLDQPEPGAACDQDACRPDARDEGQEDEDELAAARGILLRLILGVASLGLVGALAWWALG
jgi:hypothetical protein